MPAIFTSPKTKTLNAALTARIENKVFSLIMLSLSKSYVVIYYTVIHYLLLKKSLPRQAGEFAKEKSRFRAITTSTTIVAM
jgi:hypothetical protein